MANLVNVIMLQIHVNGKEVAIKFALNKYKIIDYKHEGLILNKLNDKNFFPKLYDFNFYTNSDFLFMTLMGPDLLKFSYFFGESFFNKNTIKDIGIILIEILEYLHYYNIILRNIKSQNIKT